MKLLIISALLAVAFAAPMQQSLSVNDDGSYQFFYETGREGGQHSRTEVRHPDGVVVGKYSYEDANGAIREVSYRADDQGYVANGDVGVEGAPKGQFPSPVEEEEVQSPTAEVAAAAVEDDPEPQESAAVESTVDGSKNEDEPKEELSLEEPTANDPPEAFPPGFFLQKFHGLRRLPEPTKEDKPTEGTTAEPKAEAVASDQDNETVPEEPPKDEEAKRGDVPLNEMDAFTHLRPFRSFAPQPMDTSMFRPPVYVFSYQHPDSYGYHYFF